VFVLLVCPGACSYIHKGHGLQGLAEPVQAGKIKGRLDKAGARRGRLRVGQDRQTATVQVDCGYVLIWRGLGQY
jgi:hypothetical protein